MAQTTLERTDALNAQLTVSLPREAYEPQFLAQLKEQRKNARMKGFRPGKAPLATIRKMMGDRILIDLVNREIQAGISETLEELSEADRMLGSPIPSEGQDPQNISAKDLQDLVFKFDLGFAPETIEVSGIDEELTYHKIEIPAADLQEQLERLRKQHGEAQEVEDIQDNDVIKVEAKELADGAVKEDGLSAEFRLFYDNLTPAVQKELASKKPGDTLQVNIFELENESTEKYVRSYLLSVEEDTEFNPEFELTIQSISRIQIAELDQDFFDKAFGEGKVSSEAEAIDFIREASEANLEQQSNSLFFRHLQIRTLEKTDIDLPRDFLRRWLDSDRDEEQGPISDADFERFLEGMRWSLIQNELSKQHEIKVEEEEIRGEARKQIMGYFGGQDTSWMTPDMLSGLEERMLNERESRNRYVDDILNRKLVRAIRDGGQVSQDNVSPDGMNELIDAVNKADKERYGEEEEE
jgi:trigger factor